MPTKTKTKKVQLADAISADVAAPKAARKGKAANGGPSKSDRAVAMLRKGKHTRADIAAACEWPSINLKPICVRNGLKLKKSADGILSVATA